MWDPGHNLTVGMTANEYIIFDSDPKDIFIPLKINNFQFGLRFRLHPSFFTFFVVSNFPQATRKIISFIWKSPDCFVHPLRKLGPFRGGSHLTSRSLVPAILLFLSHSFDILKLNCDGLRLSYNISLGAMFLLLPCSFFMPVFRHIRLT